MQAFIFKPKRKRNGKTVTSRLYSGRYKLDGDTEQQTVRLKVTDKRVAEQRLQDIVRQEERKRAGLLVSEVQASAAQRPLREHLDEFCAELRALNRSREYVKKIEQRAGKLIEVCNWQHVRDVTPDSFVSWRAGQGHLSAKTRNDYLDAAVALLNWLVKARRISENPLAHVQKVDGRGHQRVRRRAFTDDELQRLILAGGERGIVYLVAAKTGLRRGEIAELRWADVDLDAACPVIRARAVTTKNRRDAVLPLGPDVVEALRKWRAARPADDGELVFKRAVPNRETFAAHLETADIPRLRDGKKVDFHALRHTFVTLLQRAGIHRRVAMHLARHSDSRLTDKVYTDESALLTTEAVAQLPMFRVDDDAQTSTHDAQMDAQAGGSARHAMTPFDANQNGQGSPERTESKRLRRVSGRHAATSHDVQRNWRRGESNPRPEAFQPGRLRV
jgi:integrase